MYADVDPTRFEDNRLCSVDRHRWWEGILRWIAPVYLDSTRSGGLGRP